MLVKAHLAALAAAESPEVELQEVESLPPIEPAGGEADAAQRIAAPGKDRSPAPRPGAERGSGSGGGSPRPGAGERLACPMRECQGSATHPLDECEKFRSLPVAQRGRRVKNWSRCECCLTDCRDRRTGIRCYRRTGFRRHHLLRMVPQAEASPAGDKKRQQQQPRKPAAKGGQTTSQGKLGRGDSGRDRGQTIPPQKHRQVELPCVQQEGGDGVAQGHQEPARGCDEDHAPGGGTSGPHSECHRGLPGTAEAVQRTSVHTACGRSRDAGVR